MFTQHETHGNLELAEALNREIQKVTGFAPGNVYIAMNSTEPLFGSLVSSFNKKYLDGSDAVQPTIAAAYAATVTNRNDVVLVSANGTSNKLAAMLTVANNRVHFIGMDFNGRKIGSRAMISNSGAGAATDVAMVYITGTGCSFHNISFKNNWTVTENLYSVKDYGIQSYFENCDIESLGSAALANASCASLNLAGNECIYKNCTLGQDTLLVTSTAGQQVLVTNRGTSGTKCTRSRFDNCRFQSYTSDTTHVFVRFGAYSVDSSVSFEDCEFDNAVNATSGVALAMAFTTPSTVGGGVNIGYPRIFGATNVATSGANTAMLLAAPVNAASDAGAVTPT